MVSGGFGDAFGAFAGGKEDDFALFGVVAGFGVAFVELLNEEDLLVHVLGADGFGLGFSFGDAFGEIAGRVGGDDRRY